MANNWATSPMPALVVWAMGPCCRGGCRSGTTRCNGNSHLELGGSSTGTCLRISGLKSDESGQITGVVSRRPRPGIDLRGRSQRTLGKSTTLVWMIAWTMCSDVMKTFRLPGAEGAPWDSVNFPLYSVKPTPKPPEVTVVINGVPNLSSPRPNDDLINQQFEQLRADNLRLERFLRQDRSQPMPLGSSQPRVRRRASERAREPSSRYFCYNVDEPNDDDIEMFSLTNITTCQPRADQFSKPTNVEMMVLNLNQESKVVAHSCRLAVTKVVHFCDDYFYRYVTKIIGTYIQHIPSENVIL